ncbi:Ectopic P granules protein 5 [Chytridiales sp. JEL 0842]|nr:Ectopic P granules protein 5 [Chytridiales sp. JEL 0842]
MEFYDPAYAENVMVIVEYLFDVLKADLSSVSKVRSGENLASPTTSTFAKSQLRKVIDNIISFFDVKYESTISTSFIQQYPAILHNQQFFLRRLFVIFNGIPMGTAELVSVWEGISTAASTSNFPSVWISEACNTIASTEYMALLVEKCMDCSWNHFGLLDPNCHWLSMIESLSIPELESELFVKHCLNHSLIMVLYTYALQKLQECQDNYDMRVVIGEGIGIWLAGLKIDTVVERDAKSKTSTSGHVRATSRGRSKEAKMLLLLSLFSDLLFEELSSLPVPEHHSRLRGHLSAVADSLLKWSEDTASQGLWATLGFGPRSQLSPEFRFFCRSLGTFIVIRLMEVTGDGDINKRDEQNKARLLTGVSGLMQNRDFETCWDRIPGVLEFLNDDDKRLVHMRDLVAILGFFSDFAGREFRI